jgi:hypothetical protein
MTTEQSGQPVEKRYERRRRDAYLGPSVAIIIVALIVFFAINGRDSSASNRNTGTFSSTAVLSGVKHTSGSEAFRGGDASAWLGGVELDFRDATMEGSEATVEVTAVMGGIDIRVPRNWTVVNHVTPILGGVDDHTHPSDSNKRLVIEGTVVMGGLDIKN